VIIVSCPLRISLVGGSTDNPQFLKTYKHGSVISFPSTLNVYVTIHKDVFGTNAFENNYNIHYSKHETVKCIDDIENQLIRYCFKELRVKEFNCSLTSDIYSVGSGLAASSAYLQALIKGVYLSRGKNISQFEVCKLAEKIERNFNPLVGQQDFYGSMPSFKRINFYDNNDPSFSYLSENIFDYLDMYLLYTGVLRSSTKVLENLDIEKSSPMMQQVNDLEVAINNLDIEYFNEIIKESWQTKKDSNKMVLDNSKLLELDNILSKDSRVLSHKLCGAGNGGYFLIFASKNVNLNNYYPMMKPISVSKEGLNYTILGNESTRI